MPWQYDFEETKNEAPAQARIAEEELAKFTVRTHRDSCACCGLGFTSGFGNSWYCDVTTATTQVDEHLTDVERTVLYLNGGQQIQQRHAIDKWVLPGYLFGITSRRRCNSQCVYPENVSLACSSLIAACLLHLRTGASLDLIPSACPLRPPSAKWTWRLRYIPVFAWACCGSSRLMHWCGRCAHNAITASKHGLQAKRGQPDAYAGSSSRGFWRHSPRLHPVALGTASMPASLCHAQPKQGAV